MGKNGIAVIAVLMLAVWGIYDYTIKNADQAETIKDYEKDAVVLAVNLTKTEKTRSDVTDFVEE